MPTEYAPRPTLDQEAVRSHFRTAPRYRTPAPMWAALPDIAVLLAGLDRALSLATYARTEFGNLLAAAGAAEAAGTESGEESEALYLLRDELAAHAPITAKEIDEWSWR